MNNETKYFPKGLFYKEPHPNAPDFVKGQVSVKVSDFKSYLENVNGDWLNIDLKVSKQGKPYAEINTFKPEKKTAPQQPSSQVPDGFDDMDDDLPFIWALIPFGYTLMSILPF